MNLLVFGNPASTPSEGRIYETITYHDPFHHPKKRAGDGPEFLNLTPNQIQTEKTAPRPDWTAQTA